MKSIFYTIAVISLGIFVINCTQLVFNWYDGYYQITDTGHLTGWEDAGEGNANYEELSKNFTSQILTFKQEANKFKKI